MTRELEHSSSLDPAAFGYPAVDSGFSASYDFAMAALVGLVPQVNANYELDKNLNRFPKANWFPGNFRDHE